MEKKVMIAALFLAMFVLSSDIKLVESGPEDCIDSCYTGCVFPNDGKLVLSPSLVTFTCSFWFSSSQMIYFWLSIISYQMIYFCFFLNYMMHINFSQSIINSTCQNQNGHLKREARNRIDLRNRSRISSYG